MRTLRACLAGLAGALLLCGPALADDVRVVMQSTKDIIYDPGSGYIYASVPPAVTHADPRANSLTQLNPVTGALAESFPIGTDPGKLAISDNGQYLYVGLDGPGGVRRFDAWNRTAGIEWSLGVDPYKGTFLVEDMEVLPGTPESVAISRRNRGYSPRHEGVLVFDNDVKRPLQTPGHTGSNVIEFSASPGRLYGLNNETTEFGFRRMNVTPDGVTVADVTGGLTGYYFHVDIEWDNGRLYTTHGKIIDPEVGVLGAFDGIGGNCLVRPDSSVNRVFFLQPTTTSSYWTLRAYDMTTRALVGSQVITGINGTPTSLIRWGTNGLAFRTGNQVFLIRSSLVSATPAVDLGITMTDSPDPCPITSDITYTLQVTNHGPNPATGVVVTDRLPTGVTVRSATSTQGTCSVGPPFSANYGPTVAGDLGTLAPGAEVTVTIVVGHSGARTYSHTAEVRTNDSDTNARNNFASVSTRVGMADLSITMTDTPDPVNLGDDLIYRITIRNDGPDPATGLFFTARLDPGTTFVSASSSQASVSHNAGTVSGWLGTLYNGSSIVVVITVRPTQAGLRIVGPVQISTSDGDPNTTNNVTREATSVTAPPAAPSQLAARVGSASEIVLSWLDNSSNETGFEVERRVGSDPFVKVATAGVNATTYLDDGLGSNTSYTYRIRAVNTAGASAYSNAVDALTKPLAPVGFTVTPSADQLQPFQIDLEWRDGNATPASHRLERSDDGGLTYRVLGVLAPGTIRHRDTEVTPNAVHHYRLTATNASGDSESVTGSGLVAPARQTNLAAAPAGPGKIVLTWTDGNATPAAHLVERSEDGVSYTQVSTAPPGTPSFTDSGLAGNNTYYYQVRATNATGQSLSGSAVSALTVPGVPGSLRATAVSQVRIDLSWSDGSASPTGYEVERSTDGATFTQIGTTGTGVTLYSDTGLSAGTTYTYRVRAVNASGPSEYSGTAAGTTLPYPPAAPSSLTARKVSSSRIDLSWRDNSGNEQGFIVERSTDGSTFTEAGRVGANVRTFAATGLAANTRYWFRVRAYNAGGQSAVSNTANDKTSRR